MKIPFVKYTLHGNKFAIVDEVLKPVLSEYEKSRFAYRATDIYYGVGSDNFLVVQPCESEVLNEINDMHHYWTEPPDASDSDFIFRMFEPDGKEAFSCGNGLLCISNYLYRQYGIESARIMTEIPTSNPKILTIGTAPGKEMSWSNMGPPIQIPPGMLSPSVTIPYDNIIGAVKNINIKFPVNGLIGIREKISLAVSGFLVFTGEPHLVVFTENGFSSKKLADKIFISSGKNRMSDISEKTDYSSWLVKQIGMSLNNDYSHYFPAGLNINFVRILDGSGVIEYRCFERGINRETWACGTGAVAVSYIARHLNMVTGNQVIVWPHCTRTTDPNAQLRIEVSGNDYFLYGNPVLLFEGVFFA